jgi:hypothetical protein
MVAGSLVAIAFLVSYLLFSFKRPSNGSYVASIYKGGGKLPEAYT